MREHQQSLNEVEHAIRELKRKRQELRQQTPPEPVTDYSLQTIDGHSIRLSELFGDKTDLILIHNMGSNCRYCTMWADGFNGVLDHLESRAAFVLVNSDEPESLKEFAQSRGWRFRVCSALGSTFTKDMGFEDDDGDFMPGVSTFHKDGDAIARVGREPFGPGDEYCSVWSFFELLQGGCGEWSPQLSYR